MRYNLKTILFTGNSVYAGAILARKFLKAGHRVKAPTAFIYRNDLFLGTGDIRIIGDGNLTEIENGPYDDIDKIRKIISGCNIVIYLTQAFGKNDCSLDYNAFISLFDIAKISNVERFLCVSYEKIDESFVKKIRHNIPDNFAAIIIDFSSLHSHFPKQELAAFVNIVTKYGAYKHKIIIDNSRQRNPGSLGEFPAGWYSDRYKNSRDFCIGGITDLCLRLSLEPLKRMQNKVWPHIVSCEIFLNRFYAARKVFQILRKPYIPFIRRIRFFLNIIKRLSDVFLMMLFLHFRPEQIYRFSTRKQLPNKERRYSRSSKPSIPFELLALRTSDMPKMKEANIVLRGASFDIEKLKKLYPPIFLGNFWEPVATEKNVIYMTGGARNALRLAKMGLEVIYFEVNTIGYDGKISPNDADSRSLWYEQFINNGLCKRIALLEKVYRPPKPPFSVWAPTGSALPAICALSYFAEKINVYGWDFYLDSSPDNMTYWQLFFNLYKFKLDVLRSRNHLESAILNFYYAYYFSKLPNINIIGRLGELDRHKELMAKIEKVLFN